MYKTNEQILDSIIGKTPLSIEVDREVSEVTWHFTDGSKLVMYHRQDCCESVWIESIVGDFNDLIGVPLLKAEEVTNRGELSDAAREDAGHWQGYVTWTFYKFASIKGYVDMRWCGSSNGYYSEEVDLEFNDASQREAA